MGKNTLSRRDLLKIAGTFSAYSIFGSTLTQALWIPSALGQMVPIDGLKSLLDPKSAQILIPNDVKFKETLVSFNRRTTLTPSVRVLCVTPEAVSTCVQWAKNNQDPLAMRCGGHSYEGFSQSTGIVIDTRLMNSISVSGDEAVIGGGAALGAIYQELSKTGRAIPAGTCPTVGVTGHTTGGGYGMLARPFGLACDSLQNIEVVTANGEIINASENENADLFWACRGGGGGSFGVITQLQFKTHKVPTVATFTVSWNVSKSEAARLIRGWQEWAPKSPKEITSLMKVSRGAKGIFALRCVGQTVGSESQVTQELTKSLFKIKKAEKYTIKTKPFIDAVKQFSGSSTEYPSIFMKGKSDYVKSQTTDAGLEVLLSQLPSGIAVMFDSYGGQISELSDDATAFVHRGDTLSSVQYYMQWENAADTLARLKMMKDYHDALRGYMSGSAYVNYCDLDIEDYAEAYWGKNLPGLISIKNKFDPENFFKHAQSVPLA